VLLLLGACLALSIWADAPLRYLAATAEQLHAPAHYIRAVFP
jgi:multicomponent K+:H+ antiporter subunit D